MGPRGAWEAVVGPRGAWEAVVGPRGTWEAVVGPRGAWEAVVGPRGAWEGLSPEPDAQVQVADLGENPDLDLKDLDGADSVFCLAGCLQVSRQTVLATRCLWCQSMGKGAN